MKQLLVVLLAILTTATFAFGQGATGQAPATGGERGQRGFTFTTNGNGAIAGPDGQPQRGQRATRPSGPAPRGSDGRVLLNQAPGQPGLWVGVGGLTGPGGKPLNVPYQPWAEAVVRDRRENQLEPHTRCKPSGGPRQFLTPYGVEFVELPDLQRIFIFDIGGPHTFRIVYMDGREHPKNYPPDYYGHSVGRWEGDTLVIDSVGFNEKFWIDRGRSPHTEKLHMIERITRVDMNNMRYELTVEDPDVYTAPWTGEFNIRYAAGDELFEYICQENNFAGQLMLGVLESVDRSSPIVP